MLPEHEWLQKAKALPVGMRVRVRHRQERRPNMVIGHEAGKYWAYCQACHAGAVQDKEHVRFGEQAAPPIDLSLPADMVQVLGSAYEEPCARFLAKKNMDMKYLPTLWFSCTRKRILIDTGYGWMGRDSTERSMQKWLTYNRSQYLGHMIPGSVAIVVEDTFSWYKVMFAMPSRSVSVLCALGTDIKDSLTLECIRAEKVLWMFDGDTAGHTGAAAGVKRMRSLGVQSSEACAPFGLDPKDMHIEDIQRHLQQYI